MNRNRAYRRYLAGGLTIAIVLGAAPLAAAKPRDAVMPPTTETTLRATAAAVRDRAVRGDNVAYTLLESLTTEIGPRPAASSAMHRASDWAVAQLIALGFENVHREPINMPAWTRGQETAEVTAPFPQRLVITALGGSIATPPGGIEAEIALFHSYDDMLAAAPGSLAGKIAVVTQPMPIGGYGAYYRIRGLGPAEAAQRGAVAYLMRSLATDVRRSPHTGTMTYTPEFSGGVQRLQAQIPAAALTAVDAEQLDRMALRGRPIRLRLTLAPTTMPNQLSETVVGELRGRERPDEIVLIGGHLDSWDLGTGAIDDGAGVSITVAAAKLIAALPVRPARTIRVVLFGAEEVGRSNIAYAAAHQAAEQARIVIAGECDEGAGHIGAVRLPAGIAASPFGLTLARTLAPIGAYVDPRPNTDGGGDLESLVGVPFVSLQQDGTHYFDYHHTPDDTLDKVDRRDLDQNVAAWAAFTYLAANTDVDFRKPPVVAAPAALPR